MQDLSQTINILSAMISPVVLIMASGSLLLTTSQRLSRALDRTRRLNDQLQDLIRRSDKDAEAAEALTHLFELWQFTSLRARLLQRALSVLYLTLLFFIGTCICIAMLFLVQIRFVMLPVVTGVVGILLLLYVSLILIRESRVAVHSIDCEVDHLKRYFVKHIGEVPREQKVGWWKQLRSAGEPAANGR